MEEEGEDPLAFYTYRGCHMSGSCGIQVSNYVSVQGVPVHGITGRGRTSPLLVAQGGNGSLAKEERFHEAR